VSDRDANVETHERIAAIEQELAALLAVDRLAANEAVEEWNWREFVGAEATSAAPNPASPP
jgi:hypothetical protein